MIPQKSVSMQVNEKEELKEEEEEGNLPLKDIYLLLRAIDIPEWKNEDRKRKNITHP